MEMGRPYVGVLTHEHAELYCAYARENLDPLVKNEAAAVEEESLTMAN